MLPDHLRPMLAKLSLPFDSPEFHYEIKWDGYRCLAFLNGATRLQSRNLKELSGLFPELSSLHLQCRKAGCLLDGEIVTFRNGLPSFQRLQKRAQLCSPEQIRTASRSDPVVYIAFDLLYLEEKPVYHAPWKERRGLLLDLVRPTELFILSEAIPARGVEFFQAAAAKGLEGVMAKRADSPYLPGKRSDFWLKFKSRRKGYFVICGYRLQLKDCRIRSLILGAYQDEQLIFRGTVGSGLPPSELDTIKQLLEELETEVCPFTGATLRKKGITWLEPRLVCEVEYLELTDEGYLRHPSFKNFRPDLKTEDCRLED